MSAYPAWFKISDEFPPKLFHTAEEVPPGWTRLNAWYDTQTGQWIPEEGAKKGGKAETVDVLDLPAISGFVRDGFDRDDPENGNPPRTTATTDRADQIVAKDGPGGAEIATKERTEAAEKGNRKRRKGVSARSRKGSVMANENDQGIAKPQPDKPISKPQEDPVRRERGEDGTVRTGNAPTRR